MKKMTTQDKLRLKPKDLTCNLPVKWLPFRTTEDLGPHEGMIGQDRAMRAVDVGLQIPTRGFNIFAVGEPGSGKTSTMEQILKDRAEQEPVPDDICYVYNFASPDRPRPITLDAGLGRAFAKDMERVVGELEHLVSRVLSEGSFGHIRAGIVADTRSKADNLNQNASRIADQLGLKLEETESHLKVVPLYRGQPIDEEKLNSLPTKQRKRIEQKMLAFQRHVDSFTYSRRQLERDHESNMKSAECRAVTSVMEELIGEVANRYRDNKGDLSGYFDEIIEHAIQNHRIFMNEEENSSNEGPEMMDLDSSLHTSDPRVLFGVNALVDRFGEKGAPVVVERVPAATNLCGFFEYKETHGGLTTDHTMIRAGALHQANGGYLLIQAGDLFMHDNAWQSLKRALRHKEVRIEDGMNFGESRPRLAGALKPGVVKLDVKVILVGSHDIYYTFKLEDNDFQRLFKVLADFESSMPRTQENVLKLASFIGQVCREEKYLPLHKSGMERVIEFASRRAEDKTRMITRRAEILDLLAESNMFAAKSNARAIRWQDVSQAIAEAELRHGSVIDAVGREIKAGTILIRTAGTTVGQINGIALYDLAGITFGIPVRITARTYAGRRGVVNIDREVNLSGAIHDKGALILIGYMGGRYAQNQPLGFSASITFEQSYDEIDGDSASSAELYALISSMSGCPIKQGIAVTGSVNQLGEVQPIGGVNEKIEGVYSVCKERGFVGGEGVMIPAANIRNLILKDEVINAVKAGYFNIYAVSTIDEGIEVLTGVTAGVLRKDGTWTPDSINDRVQCHLTKFVDIIRTTPGTAYDTEL